MWCFRLEIDASPLRARTLIQVLSYWVSTYLVKDGPFSAWHAGHLSFSIRPAGFQLLYNARKNGRGTGQLIQTIMLKIDCEVLSYGSLCHDF